MGDLNIQGSSWPLVQVGRVVLFNEGHAEAGKIATIVEIIDHKRVLVDGPTSTEGKTVPRQAAPLSACSLTKIVIPNLPRGARNGTVRKKWTKAGVDEKFAESPFFKQMQRRARRKALTDFERFKVMKLQKQNRYEVRKSLAKVKAAA